MKVLPSVAKETANMIKLRILQWENYPGLCGWTQCNHHKGPYKWKREVGKSNRDLRMLHYWLWSTKECRQPLEARKGQEAKKWILLHSPILFWRRNTALLILWIEPSKICFGLWPPELSDTEFVLFKATKFVAICYGKNKKKTIQR